MTTVFVFSILLSLLLAGICIYLLIRDGEKQDRIAEQRLDIEKLYDTVAQLTKELVDNKREIECVRNSLANLDEDLDDDITGILSTLKRHDESFKEVSGQFVEITDRITELEKREKDADSRQDEIAAAISKKVEKIWDSGLQNMLNWNPFDRGESEGA